MRQDFNQWVSPFLPTLYTISGKIGKLPQWVDREDVVSQMLFDLWEKWKRGELQNKPTSYIFRNCWFAAQNYRRTSKDKILALSLDKPVDEEGTPLITLIEDDSSFFQTIEIKQSICKLKEKLTQREKEVFHLQKQEYTTREIAKKLGISHVRVVRIQQNIRKKARQSYRGYQNPNFFTYNK